MAKKEALDKILKELKESTRDIEASIIARVDGLIIESELMKNIDERGMAAMTAAIVGTAQTASRELKQGKFNQVIIESEDGKMISINAGELAILTCLVKPKANLGLILLEMKRASKKIADVVER